jgi:hypothetical protein
MARTPADYPGRPGPTIVPNQTDFMDLDRKVARRRARRDAEAHARTLPWYRRILRWSGARGR